MAECPATLEDIDGTGAVLACWLPFDHDGPHYDEADNLSWHSGKPYDWPRTTDDPPEYDPYDAAADQAEEWAAGQRELAEIETEEAHDRAGEAWHLGAYGEGGTS